MENIPHEIWEKILGYVLICDLCSFVQVSIDFYNIGTYPKFWIKTKIKQSKLETEGARSLQDIPRFAKIDALDLSYCKLTKERIEELLHYVTENINIDDVNLRDVDLSEAPKVLLARAIIGLKKANLMHSNLSTEQCDKIFEEIGNAKMRLSDVNLSANDLSEVSAPTMSLALSKLHKIELVYTNLQTAHCTCLFLSIISSSTPHFNTSESSVSSSKSSFSKSSHSSTSSSTPNLPSKSLSLGSVPLLHVPSDLLSSLLPHLHHLDLSWTSLTNIQSISILSQAPKCPSLRSLNLENVYLPGVPADLLGSAMAGLAKADLTNTMLTTPQLVAVLTLTKTSSSLLDLNLHGLDLSQVPPLLLAEAVAHLEKVDLAWTHLTSAHCPPLLTNIASSKTLTTINLQQCTALATVSTELLSSAVHHLSKVHLSSTSISYLHVSSILTTPTFCSSLCHLILYNLDLSPICPHLLSSFLPLLIHVDLTSTNLTTAQCTSTFTQLSLPSSRLQSLHMSYVSLSSVTASVLGDGVANLVTVDLSYTALSTSQCGKLLEKCTKSRKIKKLTLSHNGIKFSEVDKELVKQCNDRFTLVMARC